MTEYSIATIFQAVASAVGDREAIIDENSRITFKELLLRSTRFAKYLKKQNLGNLRERSELKNWESGQDHAGIYLYNNSAYIETLLGSFMARLAPYNVNYRYVESEFEYLFNYISPKALIYDSSFSKTLREIINKIPPISALIAYGENRNFINGSISYNHIITDSSLDQVELDSQPSPDDLYILCTGGTTGLPKATLWRQADMYYAALGGFEGLDLDQIVEVAKNTNPIKAFVIAPLMHAAGQWLALRTLLSGSTVILYRGSEGLKPQKVLSIIEKEKPFLALIVGDAFARPIADELEKGEYNTSSLKVLVTGGAITSRTQKDRLTKLIKDLTIIDVGGASETGTQLINTSTHDKSVSHIFEPEPTTTVISENKSRFLTKGENEIGWLVRMGRIPLGYLGDEEKTKATFTKLEGIRLAIPGDRARLLGDGKIELLGRDSVTINTGGEKVFAEEVEDAISSNPKVDDVVVTGIKSEKWGQEVVAVVKVRKGADLSDSELISYLSNKLARYKLPKKIIFVDSLQRSPAGKPDYRWAKETAEKYLARESIN